MTNVMKLIPGGRTDVRVVQLGWLFYVQYEYRRTPTQLWKSVPRRDGRWNDTDLKAAIARAKRVAARNN